MKRLFAGIFVALFALHLAASSVHASRVYADNTCETTATTGQDTVDLGGASGDYLPFVTQVASGSTIPYNLTSGDGKVETGIGVFTDASPDTITRTNVISSDGVGTKLTLVSPSVICLGFISAWTQPNLGTSDTPTFAGIAASSNDSGALGASGTAFSDLFLASGGVINWNAGDVTITHSTNALAFGGASSGYSFDAVVKASANDAAALGSATVSWSDLFLASGGVINWNNGAYTLTQSGSDLTASGNFSVGTSNKITTGTVELGAASDTTVSRLAAARAGIEGAPIGLYTFASSAPSSPQVGDVWVDSTTSIAYRYINDGDSSQWVQQPGNSVNTSTVKVQVFTASGTYTPTAGMKTTVIECVGGGGAGGGASGAVGFILAGQGGGGGAYARTYVTAAQVGASQTVTIGAGGTPGSAGANAGGAGGDTSVGSLCVGKGGAGGGYVTNAVIASVTNGGSASSSTGDVKIDGSDGVAGWDALASGEDHRPTSIGGASYFGGATAFMLNAGTKTAGTAGKNYGGGGTGGFTYGTTGGSTVAGAAGANGLVVVTEYLTGP